jgi:hypothetical protein
MTATRSGVTGRVVFEHLGRHYDDVLVTFAFDAELVELIRALPHWARRYDNATRAWQVHPWFAAALANAARRLGFGVTVIDKTVTP